jgi:hypothetical protein
MDTRNSDYLVGNPGPVITTVDEVEKMAPSFDRGRMRDAFDAIVDSRRRQKIPGAVIRVDLSDPKYVVFSLWDGTKVKAVCAGVGVVEIQR